MDIEVRRSMFLKAREQYDNTVRTVVLALIVIFSFHLLTLNPYVRLSRQRDTKKLELDKLLRSRDTLQGISTSLKSLSNDTRQRIKGLGDDLLYGLRSDFERLNTALHQLRADEGGVPSGSMMMAQTAQVAVEPMELDQATIARLKNVQGNNMEQIGRILRPTVERAILTPRFAALNRSWQEDVGKSIAENTGQAKMHLEKVEWRNDGIARLALDLKHTADVAATLKFSPPSDFHWWQSAAVKASSIETMQESALRELSLDRAQEQAEQVLKALDDVVKQNTMLLDDIQHRIQEADENFKQQEAKLASLGKAFEFLSLDFAVIASRFPLLLGLILGAGAIWLARRWGNLLDAYSGMPGNEVADLPRPLLLGIRGTHIGPEHFPRITGLIAFVWLFWIWISVWQLSGWSQVTFGQLIISGIIGSAVATLGLMYYAMTMKRVQPGEIRYPVER